MIRLRQTVVRSLLKVVLLLLPLAAFAIAAHLRFYSGWFPPPEGQLDLRAYMILLLVATISWTAFSEHYGLGSIERLFATSKKTRRVVAACGSSCVVTFVFAFFYRETPFSRVFVVLSYVLLVVLTIIVQMVFRVALLSMQRNGRYSIRVLVIGADEFAANAAARLTGAQITPCQIVGYVALPNQERAVPRARVSQLEDIPALANGNGIDEVVLAVPPHRFSEIPELLQRLDPLCVPIRAALDLGEGVEVKDQLFDFGGIPMLDLKPSRVESVSYVLMKRTFDLLFAGFSILVTLPVMAVIAAAVKMTSRGPILFAQDRVGLKGHVFRMYKFRTMRNGSEKESSTRWTVKDDPRCTPIGNFLRRTSLDELPQFFNVLRGDMSVVGPRPERPYFVEKFVNDLEVYNARHYMKAGMTGWAQVNGLRGDTPIDKRVEYDLYYLKNWSLSFDLQIIALTLLRGFHNKNAY